MASELPTELLLEIADFLLLDDPLRCNLCRLAQTCRRLHDIFMPRILKRHVVDVINSHMATSIVDLDGRQCHKNYRLRKEFQLDRGEYRLLVLVLKTGDGFDTVRSIRSLILRAQKIECIKLYCDSRTVSEPVLACFLNSCIRSTETLEVEKVTYPHGSRAPEEGGPFTFDFESPLIDDGQSQPEPGETSAVQETHPHPFFRKLLALVNSLILPRRRSLPPSVIDRKAKKKSVNRELTVTVTPRKPRCEVSLPRTAPLITNLSISGEELFYASMYPWTRHVLNSAPLTRLSITKIDFNLYIWTQILASVTIPTLLHLTIGSISVTFPDLASFLERHNALKSLDLREHTLIGIVDILAPKDRFLPSLNSLAASPEFLLPFFHYQDKGYFSLLKNYNLTNGIYSPSSSYDEKYKATWRKQYYPIFEHLSKGSFSDLHITLHSVSASALMEWMMTTSTLKHGLFVNESIRRLPGIITIVLEGDVSENGGDILSPNDIHHLKVWTSQSSLMSSITVGENNLNYEDVPSMPSGVFLESLLHFICPTLVTVEKAFVHRDSGSHPFQSPMPGNHS